GSLASLSGDKAQRLKLRIAGLFLRGRQDEAASFKLVEEVLRDDPLRGEAFALLEDMVLGARHDGPMNGTATNGEAERESLLPPDADNGDLGGSMPPPSGGAYSSIPPSVAGHGSIPPPRGKRNKKRAPSVREKAASMLKERYRTDARHHEL